MSIWILLSVLAAALLHASWNGLVRLGASRLQVMMVLSAAQGMIGLVLGLSEPWPGLPALKWIIASALAHSFYKAFLTYAYTHGDLSRVYPLARGTAPLVVLVVGSLFLGEGLRATEVAGICVLGLGILLLAGGVFTAGESRRLLPYAFGSAMATAAYTVVDGVGARVATGPVGFLGWVFVLDGLCFGATMLALHGRASLPPPGKVWAIGALGAAASYGSYSIVVWAMTRAPIALVSAIRETSIVFGVLIGWLAFGERMTPVKGLSALLIAGGVIITRL